MSEKAQCPFRQMKQIDPTSLNDLPSRITYLKSFLNFTDEDGAAIQASKALIAPLLPAVLDIIYTHLLSYDITAKAFVPPQSHQKETRPINVLELSLEHPNIKHRKDFLKGYLVRLVSNSNWADDSSFWQYLDRVGLMHTGQPGFSHRKNLPELRVEYVHMGLLLGFVEDVIVKTTLEADLDVDTKQKVIRAFNKLLWIQNDLFARHFLIDKDSGSAPAGTEIHRVCLHSNCLLTNMR
jgi:hypothetical protein